MEDGLTDEEMQQLILLAKKVLWAPAEVRRQLQENRINITPANFYSNVPLVSDIETSFEYRNEGEEVYNSGLFDPDKIGEFIDALCEYSEEFSPPLEAADAPENSYYWRNTAFSYSDAMSYYCVLRHFKPEHVLEIGSGYSTLVADAALRQNGSGRITLLEPYPMDFLRELESVTEILETFAQDIPVPQFVELVESTDVWFIDSTHTVKIGSDCLYIYLKVMPEIKKDIIVHTHDIYLPFAMPARSALDRHIYWTEQYLLYAYFLENPKIEVLFGSAYGRKVLPDKIDQLMGDKHPGGGGSIWYKLNGASAATNSASGA